MKREQTIVRIAIAGPGFLAEDLSYRVHHYYQRGMAEGVPQKKTGILRFPGRRSSGLQSARSNSIDIMLLRRIMVPVPTALSADAARRKPGSDLHRRSPVEYTNSFFLIG